MTLTPSSPVPRAARMDVAATNRWDWPTPWIQAPSVAPNEDVRGPTPLTRLYVEQGQSPWVEGLHRRHILDGTLARMVHAGIRGVSVSPTQVAVAIDAEPDYDEQLSWLVSTGCSLEEAHREIAATDVLAACAILHQVYLASQARDGFVSLEIAPDMATRTNGAVGAARRLHQRIDRPNLLAAVPATAQGIPAVRALVSAGRNINVTSIFGLERYSTVIDAYLSGVETYVGRGGDPATVHGTASFAVGPVGAEVDKRLAVLHGHRGEALASRVAVAQARLAYRLFEERFSTGRWARLASQGAHPQTLVWTSVESPNDVEAERGYVENLVAPDSITVMSERTLAAFEYPALMNRSLLDIDPREAASVLDELRRLGVDLNQVASDMETHRAQRSQRSMGDLLNGLHARREHR